MRHLISIITIFCLSSCQVEDRSIQHKEVVLESRNLPNFPKGLLKKHSCYGQILKFWKPSKVEDLKIEFLLKGQYHCVLRYGIVYSEGKLKITKITEAKSLHVLKIVKVSEQDGQLSLEYAPQQEKIFQGDDLKKIIAADWDLSFMPDLGIVDGVDKIGKIFEHTGEYLGTKETGK
jgi:hypothetical protein